MAEYLIQDTTLTAIADAIRMKTGKDDSIPVSEMANEIANVTSGSVYRVDYSLNTSKEPIGATIYGWDTIYGCMGIPTLEWVDTSNITLTTIPERAFQYCSNLDFNIPNSVEYIGKYAFSGSGITTATIPEGITTIYTETFSKCKNLTKVVIPDSLTTYEGTYTFQDCDSIKEFTVGKNVTTLSYGMFFSSASIVSVVFENPSGWYVTATQGATAGTNISSSQLSDPATAANLLANTYKFYYWYRR